MPGTDLIKAGADSPFAVLQVESSELLALLRENIGSDSLTAGDLDRVKVPAGGGQTWEVPSVDGIDSLKEIEGVIVHRATRRAYWQKEYEGQSDAPDCSSDDGLQGFGIPGGACAECPFNEWDSGKGGAKACKETRQLFVLTKDSLIPIVITIPPGSLGNVRTYFLRLMRARLQATDVVTKIALERANNKTGITYSKVTLTAGERLDAEASALLKQYAGALQPAFRAAARVERDEVGEE